MSVIQLLEVNKAIDVCLEKIRRKPRTLRNFRRLIRQGERKLLPFVKEWMNESIKEMKAGLLGMHGRTLEQTMNSIANWDAIRTEGKLILRPILLELLGEGGKAVVERSIMKQERFDVIGIEAVKWAAEYCAKLVTEITKKTMDGIKAYIAKGIDAGKAVPKIARELRPLVGLTEKQIMAVANYHEMLILERPEYTAARQRSMAEVYARRLHRDRAALIARTESAAALNEGVLQGYAQMGIKKVQRIEDPDCCDECKDADGQIYTIEEAEGVLPAHPACEGAWVMA